MSTDRELLELAAKAAGIKPAGYIPPNLSPRQEFQARKRIEKGGVYYVDGQIRVWDPLTDDGDALRLAVKLKMVIMVGQTNVTVLHQPKGFFESPAQFTEAIDDRAGDALSATRRAIVRAAAEIGKAGA